MLRRLSDHYFDRFEEMEHLLHFASNSLSNAANILINFDEAIKLHGYLLLHFLDQARKLRRKEIVLGRKLVFCFNKDLYRGS